VSARDPIARRPGGGVVALRYPSSVSSTVAKNAEFFGLSCSMRMSCTVAVSVAASAGKNDSIRSSCSVMSCGVPRDVKVVK
jgi:hypothetical protein